MKWRKTHNTGIWRARYGNYYLLVQRRRGGKSHPIFRYYWRVTRGLVLNPIPITNYIGLDYEMNIKAAMKTAKAAVLEARICDSLPER